MARGEKPSFTQKRGDETRAQLIELSKAAFAQHGFDGFSLRSIESQAGVQPGTISYHFGGRDGLWKAVVDSILLDFQNYFGPLATTLFDLPEEERIRAIITAAVRFNATHTELSKIMIREGAVESWRLDYFLDKFIRNQIMAMGVLSPDLVEPHLHYIVSGAAIFPFHVGAEVKSLFGADVKSDEFIRQYANVLSDMAISWRRAKLSSD